VSDTAKTRSRSVSEEIGTHSLPTRCSITLEILALNHSQKDIVESAQAHQEEGNGLRNECNGSPKH